MKHPGRAEGPGDPHWRQMQSLAEMEVGSIIRGLPRELRDRANDIAVRFERVPSRMPEIARADDDLLGLFVGADLGSDDGSGVLPPQIILFLENLWDYSAKDVVSFRREVRTTYLHELGHFLGLDENEVEDRGL